MATMKRPVFHNQPVSATRDAHSPKAGGGTVSNAGKEALYYCYW
jgi:hypothetical protein